MNENLKMLLIVIVVIVIGFSVIAGMVVLMYYSQSSYDSKCLQKTAINFCESEDLVFNSAYKSSFYCLGGLRAIGRREFKYLPEEKDACKTKQASSWEIFEPTGPLKPEIKKYKELDK